ncbi:MAG: hypothetical protein K5876_04830 [Ruminiclostridium sp.]|nr:hypothetical protein [Ruminiclostridium sp.]
MKKTKNKAYKIVTVALFAAMLISLPVLTFVFNPSDPEPFSENENKKLAKFPEVSFNSFRDESLMNGIEDWFSDRFFGREEWIRAKNGTERLLGKTDVNGIYTADDRMIEIWEGFDPEYVGKSLNAVNKFAAKYPGKPMYFLLAPTSQEVYSGLFPQGAPIGSQTALFEFCRDNLKDITAINVIPTMKTHSADYIYYRTDHHWTSFGAYLAYYDAAKVMGFKPSELNEFDIEHASDSFRGTLYSKTLDNGVTPDVIDYYHLRGAGDITLTIGDNTYDSLYFRDFLKVKDKYSSFLGQNSPQMEIQTGAEGPSLLIFKDSYAHSMIPFLTAHFSRITVLDMRYIKDGVSNHVNVDDYDSVLFIYNAITFSQDRDIRTISIG